MQANVSDQPISVLVFFTIHRIQSRQALTCAVHSTRRENYKQFQEFTETDPMKIIKHCSTRWLSLERCVQRTLQQWPALKSYFQSHAECEKPGRINRCMQYFTSDQMWLYFAFLEFVMPILNDFNVMFLAGESMIGNLHTEVVRLLRKMMGKFVTTSTITAQSDITKIDFRCTDNQQDNTRIAVGMKVRVFLSDNDDLAPQTVNNFFSTVREFYCTMTETMIKKFPFQDKVLRGISFLNPLSKDKLSPDEGKFFVSLVSQHCPKDERKGKPNELAFLKAHTGDIPPELLPSGRDAAESYMHDIGSSLKLPRDFAPNPFYTEDDMLECENTLKMRYPNLHVLISECLNNNDKPLQDAAEYIIQITKNILSR
ncbi:unnamed protein product [Mytilus coruscus]|uniref:Uncharacterized protein n=1 Tax=Mytilus coruscus TaxID=42192 RepID=A0A6J8D6H6_MYTCO|nr:unnamed protein product [Mytilus coruscus]